MGVACGTQAVLCEYPIRFDTYKGCSHNCSYCFARAKQDISKVEKDNCVKQLVSFVKGGRTHETNWCDWDIPLHWGGLSDPFQPIEKEHRISLECLKVFAETGYPVIISTKGKLIAEEPYLSLLRECNAVVQISMVCESYDVLEPGAPTYRERVEMLSILSGNCKRVILRAQPYIVDVRDEFISNLEEIAETGAYGVTVEGMKFKKSKPGLVKVEGDCCYKEERLKADYAKIKEAAHRVGLAFFCAENRLRGMGDSFACCGCGDIEGFGGNQFNAVSLLNGRDVKPTERMKKEGTGGCFKSMNQKAGVHNETVRKPFGLHMLEAAKRLEESFR